MISTQRQTRQFNPPARAFDPTPVAPVEVQVTNRTVGVGATGANKPVFGTLADDTAVVFKHNTAQNLPLIARMMDGHRVDRREVLASHIFRDELGLEGVTYREGYYVDADGQRHDGIVSELLPHMSTLEKTAASAIKNPDEAVEQSIVKGWMGDWDIIHNQGNIWLTSDRAVAGDFGQTMQRGIQELGIAHANTEVMAQFATPENVQPVVDRIRQLSDGDIRGMVDRTGHKWIHDWTPQDTAEMSAVLIHNRDEARKSNPWACYYQGIHPLNHGAALKFMSPLASNFGCGRWEAGIIGRYVVGMLKDKVGRLADAVGIGSAA